MTIRKSIKTLSLKYKDYLYNRSSKCVIVQSDVSKYNKNAKLFLPIEQFVNNNNLEIRITYWKETKTYSATIAYYLMINGLYHDDFFGTGNTLEESLNNLSKAISNQTLIEVRQDNKINKITVPNLIK